MLHAVELSHRFRVGAESIPVLNGLSLEAQRGEFLAVLGPSGSGKSTLLHVLGGLLRPESGRVRIDGRDLTNMGDGERSRFRNRSIGFIFQTFHLQPDATALENVELPLVFAGIRRKERRPRAAAALESVGLSNRSAHRPHQLSGGEMQRVAIARAIVAEPLLILADEPTGNLDRRTGEIVLDTLLRIRAERRITFLLVTHNEAAARTADRRFRMEDGRVRHESS